MCAAARWPMCRSPLASARMKDRMPSSPGKSVVASGDAVVAMAASADRGRGRVGAAAGAAAISPRSHQGQQMDFAARRIKLSADEVTEQVTHRDAARIPVCFPGLVRAAAKWS